MSIPWWQRLILALNYTPPGTQTWLHSSFQTPGSRPAPVLTFSRHLLLFWAGANLTTCRLCIWLRLNTASCASLRDPRLLECSASSAALPTGDWLTHSHCSGASLRSSRKRGRVSGQ